METVPGSLKLSQGSAARGFSPNGQGGVSKPVKRFCQTSVSPHHCFLSVALIGREYLRRQEKKIGKLCVCVCVC